MAEIKAYEIDSIDEDVTGELQPEGEFGIIEKNEEAMTLLERIKVRQDAIEGLEKLYEFRTRALREKIEQADKWLADEKVKYQRQIDFFKMPLKQFMEAINASNPKIKSLNLPTGKLKLRKLPDKIVITDGFKATADDYGKPGIFEKLTYEINRTAIKEHLKKTGEMPDYATIETGETKFEVEVY